MITHESLGEKTFARSRQLKILVIKDLIRLGGNKRLKIYGLLNCKSGRRMKVENRVFFASEAEAINLGYRPCGHCMPEAYRQWKADHDRLRHK